MSKISEKIREAALHRRPTNAKGASLYAWTRGDLWDEICEFLDAGYMRHSFGFLGGLPDNDSRRVFLLLVAEALE
jgi:hypothetical protein